MIPPRTSAGQFAWLIMMICLIMTAVGLTLLIRRGEAELLTYLPAKVLFPYGLAAARATRSFWDIPVMLYLLQYPAYAVIATVASLRGRFRVVVYALIAFHLVAVAFAI